MFSILLHTACCCFNANGSIIIVLCTRICETVLCRGMCIWSCACVCTHVEAREQHQALFLRLYPPMFGNKSLLLSEHYSEGCAELQKSAHILCSPIPAMELTGYTTLHSFVCFKTWVLRSNSDFHAHRTIPLLAGPSTQSYIFIWKSGNILPHALFFLVKIALSSLVCFSPDTHVCICVFVCVYVLMCF